MKIEWHHWLIAILVVFAGVSLYRRNFLGVPSMVDGLVGGVAGTVSSVVPATTTA
ncbi:MAG TPA: hypothetical protein VGJ33_16270 [Candidatus Angelobacter sp.]|jgi:hypothetical protein